MPVRLTVFRLLIARVRGGTMPAQCSRLPALTGDKDQSLQAALSRMLAEYESRRPHRRPHGRRRPARDRRAAAGACRGPYAPFPEALDPRLQAALRARGIDQLYTHQAEAIAHALAGRNVVIVTPTASGKTLCYNAPVLDAILENASTRALYLFPTKALAQDQLAELHQLAEIVGVEGGGDDRRVHVRRRHAAGRAPRDSRRARMSC